MTFLILIRILLFILIIRFVWNLLGGNKHKEHDQAQSFMHKKKETRFHVNSEDVTDADFEEIPPESEK